MIWALSIICTLFWIFKSILILRQYRCKPEKTARARLMTFWQIESAVCLFALFAGITLQAIPLSLKESSSLYICFCLWVWGQIALWPLIKLKTMPPLALHDKRNSNLRINPNDTTANARAYGAIPTPFILVTQGLKDLLQKDHFNAILAHEAGHLHHHHHIKIILLATLPQALIALGPTSQTLGSLLLGFCIMRDILHPIRAFFMRRFEFQADRFAASCHGHTLFADSLCLIWQHNTRQTRNDPIFSFCFIAHPPPDLRLARLKEDDVTKRVTLPV